MKLIEFSSIPPTVQILLNKSVSNDQKPKIITSFSENLEFLACANSTSCFIISLQKTESGQVHSKLMARISGSDSEKELITSCKCIDEDDNRTGVFLGYNHGKIRFFNKKGRLLFSCDDFLHHTRVDSISTSLPEQYIFFSEEGLIFGIPKKDFLDYIFYNNGSNESLTEDYETTTVLDPKIPHRKVKLLVNGKYAHLNDVKIYYSLQEKFHYALDEKLSVAGVKRSYEFASLTGTTVTVVSTTKEPPCFNFYSLANEFQYSKFRLSSFLTNTVSSITSNLAKNLRPLNTTATENNVKSTAVEVSPFTNINNPLFRLEDDGRMFEKIEISQDKNYLAISDNLGRIWILDELLDAIVVDILKGWRNAKFYFTSQNDRTYLIIMSKFPHGLYKYDVRKGIVISSLSLDSNESYNLFKVKDCIVVMTSKGKYYNLDIAK